MIFFLILGVILGAVSVIFISQNTMLVTVTFLTWQFDGSLAPVLILTIACGIVITLLFLLPSLIRETFYVAQVEKQNKELGRELADTKQKLVEVMARSSGITVVSTNESA